MMGAKFWRAAALVALIVLLAGGGSMRARAQAADEAEELNHQMYWLVQAGKYKEAVEVEECDLVLREQQAGPDDPDVALVLNNLAEMYRTLGRFAEAEPLYRRILAIHGMLAFLTAPSRLEIVAGGHTFQKDAGPGLALLTVPAVIDRPLFRIVRAGAVIAQVEAHCAIAAAGAVPNLFYYGGSSNRPVVEMPINPRPR